MSVPCTIFPLFCHSVQSPSNFLLLLLKLRPFEIFWSLIRSVQWPCYVLLHYIMRNKTLWGHWMDQYEDQKMTNGLSLRLKTFKDNWMKWRNHRKISHGLDLSHCTLARLPHEMHQPSIAKSWKSKHFRSFFSAWPGIKSIIFLFFALFFCFNSAEGFFSGHFFSGASPLTFSLLPQL